MEVLFAVAGGAGALVVAYVYSKGGGWAELRLPGIGTAVCLAYVVERRWKKHRVSRNAEAGQRQNDLVALRTLACTLEPYHDLDKLTTGELQGYAAVRREEILKNFPAILAPFNPWRGRGPYFEDLVREGALEQMVETIKAMQRVRGIADQLLPADAKLLDLREKARYIKGATEILPQSERDDAEDEAS